MASLVEIPPSSREVHDVLRPLRKVLAALMRSEALTRGDLDAALEQVTEVASQTLRVARASVWILRADGSAIECANLFEAEGARHSKGTVIAAIDAPAYFDALREARSIAANDARTDPRTKEFTAGYLEPLGITSMLDAPVLLRGELVGIVCQEHIGPARKWHFWEELIAATLADFVAMVLGAMEHAAQAKELADHRAHLEELVAERTERLQRAEHHLRLLFEASPVAVVLARSRDHAVLDANPKAAALFELGEAEIRRMTTTDFWVNVADRAELQRALAEGGVVEGFTARLRTATRRELWGEISARSVAVDGEECVLVGVHDVTSRIEIEEQLRKLATTDGLTGVFNRRHFFELAEAEVRRCERYGQPMALAMIDVDHFKRLNDRHGHAAGDDALRALARVSAAQIRNVDVLARYGGEEFVVLLPETSLEGAVLVVERLRARVAAEVLKTPSGPDSMTVSIGVVERWQGEALDETLRRADASLYLAKAQGRDRVVADGKK